MSYGSHDPERTMPLSGLASLAPHHDEAELAHAKAMVQARLLGRDMFGATKIGRFVVLERFAEGGMGLVFAAYDPQLDRKVAVKLLRRELSEASVRKRMVREAQAMAKLSHPNVAQIYEVGEDRERTFIAMEFVVGDTLAKWQTARARGWREVLAAYVQAGRGLAAAHAAGLVHRDFKPDNVMVGHDARVRVLDFGLARVEQLEQTGEIDCDRPRLQPDEDALRSTLTHEGSIMGTPAYMAPEQLAGASVDAKADQFGFCVALWEGLFGTRPFEGATRTALVANVTAGRMREPPRDARVPGWIKAVLVRGLEVAPADRHPSMDALLTALDRDPSRRRRRIAAAIAATIVVASGFGALSLARSRQRDACARDAASIADVWDDGARDSIRSALLDVGPQYAVSTVERVVPRLDAWAADWSSLREQNCVAMHLEHSRTVELAQRANACLDERREAFETLVDMLRGADDAVLQTAAVSSAELTDPTECADEDVLRRRATVSSADARAEGELGRRLAAIEVMLTARRIPEALASAESVIDASDPVGPVRARGLMAAAIAHGESSDHERAAVLAEQAVVLALRLGDDEVAFDAMLVLMGELVETGARDQAQWWTVPAGALVERLGEADGLRGAAHLHSRAYLADDASERRELLQRALDIRESRLGPDHPDVATTVSDLGVAIERMGEPLAARAFHERALALRERALGSDHPHVANSLINMGQSYSGRREFSRALEVYGRALAIWQRALGPNHRNCALALGNLAAIHMYMDDHAGAEPLLEQAIAVVEHAHGPDHPFLVDHLVNLATIHQRREQYTETHRLFERAIAIGEAWGGKDYTVLAAPLLGMGEVELLQGRVQSATERFERALAIFERKREDLPNLAHARFALARALWNQQTQRPRATALARSAIDEYRRLEGDWGADVEVIEQWLARQQPR